MSIFVDIEKTLGNFHLKVKFQAEDETLALLGASGCGKSMTLKCIAGIEKPDRGRIIVDDVVLFDSERKINLTPQQRRTGLMFQNYALFPNMTVAQNIRTGTCRERDKKKQEEAVLAIMERFGLTELANQYPHQLSGGQQQRVALARLLVSDPRILLLDEPFSALDSHLRFRMEQEVRQVIRQFGKTVLLVSHDRDEVFRMSDSIAIMDGGRIEAVGKRDAIFRDPQTRKGAVLTGCKNISDLEVLDQTQIWATDWDMALDVRQIPEGATAVGIRMHDIRYGPGENSHRCRVVETVENPFTYTVFLEPIIGNCRTPIGWELDKETWRKISAEEITISLSTEALLLLKDSDKVR